MRVLAQSYQTQRILTSVTEKNHSYHSRNGSNVQQPKYHENNKSLPKQQTTTEKLGCRMQSDHLKDWQTNLSIFLIHLSKTYYNSNLLTWRHYYRRYCPKIQTKARSWSSILTQRDSNPNQNKRKESSSQWVNGGKLPKRSTQLCKWRFQERKNLLTNISTISNSQNTCSKRGATGPRWWDMIKHYVPSFITEHIYHTLILTIPSWLQSRTKTTTRHNFTKQAPCFHASTIIRSTKDQHPPNHSTQPTRSPDPNGQDKSSHHKSYKSKTNYAGTGTSKGASWKTVREFIIGAISLDVLEHIEELITTPQEVASRRKFKQGFEWDWSAPEGFSGAIQSSIVADPLPTPPPISSDPLADYALKRCPELFKVVCPIDTQFMNHLLSGHPNQDFVKSVIRGLEEGYWPMANTPGGSVADVKNHSVCNEQTDLLEKARDEEIQEERY